MRAKEDFRSALAEYTMVSIDSSVCAILVSCPALTQALRLEPKHFNSYINRGVAWEKMNKCENAVDDFTKVLNRADISMSLSTFLLSSDRPWMQQMWRSECDAASVMQL